jgi:hypothetical protein
MTQRVKRDRASREFVPVALPASVVLAVQELVRVRPEIREAHLVGMRLTRGARAHPTLVLVSDDSAIVTTLGEDLRRVLNPDARPRIVVFTDVDELIHVRGLGGELKRGEERFPWWLLFLGV